MREAENKLSDNRQYMEEAGCTTITTECRSSNPEQADGKCSGCPYGRAFPCIGWCTREVLASVKGGGR